MKRSPPNRIRKFGQLTTTGHVAKRVVGQLDESRLYSEVVCRHGNKRWVRTGYLNNKFTTNCRRWDECNVPKQGQRFGSLAATGRIKRRVIGRQRRLFAEVTCEHDVKKWIRLDILKIRESTNRCRTWKECGLTRGEQSHYDYLRTRTPAVNRQQIFDIQQVCIICGNVRSNAALNSREHFIPVVRFVRMKEMELSTKQALAHSLFNIFGAHSFCNKSRGDMPLAQYWKLHPEYEAPVRQAFANMMALRNPQGDKAMRIIKRLLREADWLLGANTAGTTKKIFASNWTASSPTRWKN